MPLGSVPPVARRAPVPTSVPSGAKTDTQIFRPAVTIGETAVARLLPMQNMFCGTPHGRTPPCSQLKAPPSLAPTSASSTLETLVQLLQVDVGITSPVTSIPVLARTSSGAPVSV